MGYSINESIYGYDEENSSEGRIEGPIDMKDNSIINIRNLRFTSTDDNVAFNNRQLKQVSAATDQQDVVSLGYADGRYLKKSDAVMQHRVWTYEGLKGSIQYPVSFKTGYPCAPITLNGASSRAYVLLEAFSFDDDGNITNESIQFYMRFTTYNGVTQTNNEKLILTVDLSSYEVISTLDGQGGVNVVGLGHRYNLSQITEHAEMRTFFIGVKQSSGVIRGNETCLSVSFCDPG